MTSAAVGTRPSGATRRSVRRVAALVVVAATLPYLSLKTAWLAGSTVGVLDPAFLVSPGVVGLNIGTAGMDLTAIAVALALTFGWGRRIPAWMPISTMWIGAGFLLPAMALFALTVLTGGSFGPEPLAGWVKPVVYGGFSLQALGLTVAFAGYAAERWPSAWGRHDVVPPARTLARGAAVPLVVVAVLQAVRAFLPSGAPSLLVFAAVLAAAVVGGLAVTEGRGGPVAVVTAWVGTGGAVAWGLYEMVNALVGTVFSRPGSPEHLAGLAQTLGGLVMALAVLTVLVARHASAESSVDSSVDGSERSELSVDSSSPASKHV